MKLHTSAGGHKLNLFSFGYWGWGNHLKELVAMMEALERFRRFKPPILVDIRL